MKKTIARAHYKVIAHFKAGHTHTAKCPSYNAAHDHRHAIERQYRPVGTLDHVEIIDKRGLRIWPRPHRATL